MYPHSIQTLTFAERTDSTFTSYTCQKSKSVMPLPLFLKNFGPMKVSFQCNGTGRVLEVSNINDPLFWVQH